MPATNGSGFSQTERQLALAADLPPYAENLLQWLHQLPFDTTISVGQPARNKAYRKVHFDKRKADPTESLACARFAIVERPGPTPYNPPEFQQLRDAVAMMEAGSKQKIRLVNQLHGLMARVFPELAVHVIRFG